MTAFNQPISTYDNWGIDPSYMTPAYMANFRPSYGNDGDERNPYAMNQSLSESVWMGVGPGSTSFGADPLQYFGAAKHELATSTVDASMKALQSVGIPLATWYLANNMIGKTGLAKKAGAAMGAGGSRALTGTLGKVLNKVPGVGSIARGMGAMGMGSAMASGAGALGGLAGAMFLPVMAGAAVSSALSPGIIDPYVSTRRGMDSMRANVANQYVHGHGQSTHEGFGMSAVRAAEISGALTIASAEDTAYNIEDYNKFADFGMRSGLFQEMGNLDSKTIVDSVKGLADLVQSITSVTGDPDFQNAIGVVSKLKAGGLDDLTKMSQAVKRLGFASAASGVSVDQIINTVGNQGMIMAQQEGMTGVTGLLASADAYAGFTNARKSGLISGATIGALGDIEGMTQNVMSGALRVMDGAYGRMTMQPGSSMGQGVTESILKWGAEFTEDPILSMGDWNLNQSVYKDKTMREQGSVNIIIKTLQAKARQLNKDPSDVRVLAALAPSEGLSNEEFRSTVVQYKAMTDDRSREQMRGAREAKERQGFAAQLVDDGYSLNGIWGIGTAQRLWVDTGAQMQAGMSNIGNYVAEVGAHLSDEWDRLSPAVLGADLTDQIRTRVEGTDGMATEYSLQGGHMRADYRRKLGDEKKMNFVESNEWRDEISSIMSATQSTNPKVKNKAMEVLKMLEDTENRTPENTHKFKNLLTELNDLTGTISSSDNLIDRNEELNRITDMGYAANGLRTIKKDVKGEEVLKASAIEKYNSYAILGGNSYSSNEDYKKYGYKDITGMSVKERGEVLQSIFGARGDNKKLSKIFEEMDEDKLSKVGKLLKVDKSIMNGKDVNNKRAALMKNAKEISTGDGGDIADEEDLLQRAYLQTGDMDFAKKLIATGHGSHIMELSNDKIREDFQILGIGNTKTNEVASEYISNAYNNHKAGKALDHQYDEAAKSNLNTDTFKDLSETFTDVSKGMKESNDSNTKALNRLTDTLNNPRPGSLSKAFKSVLETSR